MFDKMCGLPEMDYVEKCWRAERGLPTGFYLGQTLGVEGAEVWEELCWPCKAEESDEEPHRFPETHAELWQALDHEE